MKKQILDFFELRDKIEDVVKQYVQDKSISLDDRWEIFERSGFGEHNCWIKHLDSLHDDICMYDGLVHVDRNQDVSVFYIIETYKEDVESYNNQDWCKDNILEWKKYGFDPDNFKEECMQKFVKGWKYDW